MTRRRPFGRRPVGKGSTLPASPAAWIKEIDRAFEDAREALPFGSFTAAELFHLAPVVCLKFRGLKVSEKERKRITKVALANYVVHAEPDPVAQRHLDPAPDLKGNPRLAFALCYVASHLALDLLDEPAGERILSAYETHLGSKG